jgi:hypothetical protein
MTLKEKFFQVVQKEKSKVQKEFGVHRLGIFGSCAEGKETEVSDVDVLVEFDRKTFDNYMELKFFLEERLGRRVDLVTPAALKPSIADAILRGVKYAS